MDNKNFDQLIETILSFANLQIKNPSIRVRDMLDPLEAYFRGYITKTGTPNRARMRKSPLYTTKEAKKVLLTDVIERHHLFKCESLWSHIIENTPWNKEPLLQWLREHLITVQLTQEEHSKIGKNFTFNDPWKEFRENNITVLDTNGQEIDLSRNP